MESKEQPTNNQTPFIGPRIKWVFLAFVIVAVILYLFYWFQWRPANIKRDCQYQVDTSYSETVVNWTSFLEENKGDQYDGQLASGVLETLEKAKQEKETAYKECLRSNGL